MNVQARLVFCWLYLQVSFVSVLSDTWNAKVVPNIDALVKSCVVVPCTYNYPGTSLPSSRKRAIWHKKGNREEYIYHEDSISVADNFKGRTKLLGNLGQKNCTLEIDEVRDHDNGPFCFRIEIPDLDKFSFVEQCVTISMISSPKEPVLEHKNYFKEGSHAVFKCYVKHTCPSHPPSLTWSRSDGEVLPSIKLLYEGTWQVESVLSFIAKEQDHNTEVTCKAVFHGNMETEAKFVMFVKGKQNIYHIIIPVATVLGIIILLGVVGFFVIKKYKRQIQELQSRNENGLWSRISRVSRRFRSVDYTFPGGDYKH
ncbi:myelin-associated glycoprotein-like isoform X2 [Brachyhypopomus gauderio]|uniref:myelin-associated glycoprotein-like isoform X2 n=1 Tax=Brachyhypopomus gauderio TaxID=698409 RepID=UPI0040432F0F